MSREITYSGAEPQRVNKWLAQSGICSRRDAEALILAGHVSIAGEQVRDPGHKILPGQTLQILSAGAQALDNAQSYVIHKPVGYVSANPEPGYVPAARLLTIERRFGPPVPVPTTQASLAPLGRLDQDSRGLLVLSQDGVLAKALIGPDSRLDKEYDVRVLGDITPRKLALLRHGLWLDDRELRPAQVEHVGPGMLTFILQEGRNRQIRRMCELVELRVIDLFRARIGPLWLDDLPEGMWRRLTDVERAGLIAAS
jgi:23S rRNA pseudouridine2604 synthase